MEDHKKAWRGQVSVCSKCVHLSYGSSTIHISRHDLEGLVSDLVQAYQVMQRHSSSESKTKVAEELH